MGGALSEQQQVVLDYLTAGRTLTNVVAITCLGVGSLSSRIAELRRKGYPIDGTMDTDRFGRDYMKYTLAGKEQSYEGS